MNWIVNGVICFVTLAYAWVEFQKLVKQTTASISIYYVLILTMVHYGAAAFFFFNLNFNDTNIDAVRYYQGAVEATNWFSLVAVGHGIVSFLIYPFTFIGSSMATLFLVFTTISLKGFYVYLELIGISKLQQKSYWLLALFLAPSLHYFTGFIGKDALLFLLLAWVLKAVKHKEWNWQLALVLMAIFVIRPHVFFVLLMALLLVNLMDSQVPKSIKKKLTISTVVVGLAVLPVGLLFFMKLQNLSMEALQVSYHEFIAYTLNKGTTAISLSETTIFQRMGYILCMPLPFLYPLSSPLVGASAIENSLILFVFVMVLWQLFKPSKRLWNWGNDTKFALIASIGMLLLFSSYVYNLGLANRMRAVFFPYLVYFLLLMYSNQSNEKEVN